MWREKLCVCVSTCACIRTKEREKRARQREKACIYAAVRVRDRVLCEFFSPTFALSLSLFLSLFAFHLLSFSLLPLSLNVQSNVLWEVTLSTTPYDTLQHTATHCNTLQNIANPRNTLQHTATHTMHRTATHCNTLPHTATHCHTPSPLEMENYLVYYITLDCIIGGGRYCLRNIISEHLQ